MLSISIINTSIKLPQYYIVFQSLEGSCDKQILIIKAKTGEYLTETI